MSLQTKIAHNTIIHLVGKVIGLLLGVLSIVILTRYLGQTGFGYYSTIVAYLLFWGILVDFGLTLTNVQMISDETFEFNKTVNNIMSLRVILSLAFLVFAPILIWAFPYPVEIKFGVSLMVVAYVGTTIVQTLTGVFQKKLQMWKVTIAEVVGKVVMISALGLFAYQGRSLYWLFGAISLEGVFAVIVLFLFSRQLVKWKFEIDLTLWKAIFKRTWPIALSISFNLIYLKMDTIILSLTRTQAEVGVYGAAYRIVDVLTMLPAVFMGVVLPVITVYFAQKKFKELKNILQMSFDTLMTFALPIFFGTMLVGTQLMVLIAGADFVESGTILKVLVIASLAIFATSLFGYAVVGVRKQKSMMFGYLTAAIITFIGYLIFIPKFGYWGAAWMTVFSELVILVWTAVVVYRTVHFLPKLNNFFRILPATLVMSGVVYLIRDWNALVVILIAGTVYFPVLIAFGGLKLETVKSLIRLKSED